MLLSGRSELHLDAVRHALGPRAYVVRSDTASLADIDALGALGADKLGQVDLVHINAGISELEPVERVTEASYDRLCAVNTKGVFCPVQRLAPHSRRHDALQAD